MKKLYVLALALFWVVRASALPMPSMTPDDVVRGAVETVVQTAKTNPAAKDGDIGAMAAVVRREFLPYTDFKQTTRLAAGAAWATMNLAQQEQLVRQFTTLLVRTYALQLLQIRNEKIHFSFAPAKIDALSSDAVVKTEVSGGGGDDLQVSYRLVNTASGWRIYDIDMMGIWLIQLYQSPLKTQFSKGGADGLIQYLADHNARFEG